MSTNAIVASESRCDRYEAVVRISEVLTASSEPEGLAKTLSSELEKFLYFDHLYIAVLKENSKEVEYRMCGKGNVALPDLPMEELPIWEAIASPNPVRVIDWNGEQRSPRFKQWVKRVGFGSGVSIPLSTPHRRLGTLGIARDKLDPFSDEDIGFLRLIGRVVAFALDDGLNLKRAQDARACVQHQNERLQLLLNLTNRITSNREQRELFRAIAANIREVMQCDAVAVSLPQPDSDKAR